MISFTSASVILVWLLLALPGYVLLKRYQLVGTESGGLGILSIAYLYSFVLYTPVSLLGYTLHLPLWVFVTYIAVLIAASGVIFIRMKLCYPLRIEWTFLGCISTCILCVCLLLALRVGGHMWADSVFHVSRVRLLMDHGFNNWEPYFKPHHFSRVYHTNLYHVLLAAIAQGLRIGPWDAWQGTLAWANLVTSSGIYFLAWSISRNKQSAWLSALLYLAWTGAVPFLLYPNKVAPYWLLSLVIGLVLILIRQPTKKHLLSLGAALLMFPQVHSLYSIFAFLIVTPTLFAAACWYWRSERAKSQLLIGGTALPFLAAPFLGIAKYVDMPPKEPSIAIAGLAEQSWSIAKWFDFNAACIVDSASYTDFHAWEFWLILVLILILFSQPKITTLPLLLMMGVVLAVYFLPPLCTTIIHTLGFKTWMIRRMGSVLLVTFIAVTPWTALNLFGPFGQRWSVQLFLLAICLAIGLNAGHWKGANDVHWNWHKFIAKALIPLPELEKLAHNRNLQRDFLRKHLPPGETVLMSQKVAPQLVSVYDMYTLASAHTSPSIPGKGERKKDYAHLWSKDHVWDSQYLLLRKYNIRYVVFRSRYDKKYQQLYAAHASQDIQGAGIRILAVK